MRSILLLSLGISSLMGFISTTHCVSQIFNSLTLYAILVSISFSLIALALQGCTTWLWQIDGVFGYGFKMSWLVIVFLNLLAVGQGNWSLLGGQSDSGIQLFTLMFLTIVTAFSPIAWSYIYSLNEHAFR